VYTVLCVTETLSGSTILPREEPNMAKKTKAREAYATRLEDLKLASKVIGDTHAARLGWVVRFIAEDTASWHPAVRTIHGDCLLALGRGGVPDNLVGGLDLPDALTPEEVDALHGELRATVRELLTRNPTGAFKVPIPTDGLMEGLVRCTPAGSKPAMFAPSYTPPPATPARTAIFQAVKTLLLQVGEPLIACPACQTPFLAVRKMLFCSPRCAQRARNDKREAKRPRKTERRRGGR